MKKNERKRILVYVYHIILYSVSHEVVDTVWMLITEKVLQTTWWSFLYMDLSCLVLVAIYLFSFYFQFSCQLWQVIDKDGWEPFLWAMEVDLQVFWKCENMKDVQRRWQVEFDTAVWEGRNCVWSEERTECQEEISISFKFPAHNFYNRLLHLF